MRLNVPPTLKQSAMIDSYSLNVKSPTNINPKGKFDKKVDFKTSKHFQEDESEIITNEIITTQLKKQTMTIQPAQLRKSKVRKQSFEFEDEIQNSEASFLMKMPLFKHDQAESNFSQIKISEIPKRQLDYQQEFNDEEESSQIKNLKRKLSSGDLQQSIRNSSEALKSGFRRLRSIDVINEESTSSPGTSLNGSRSIQHKAQMISSLRKVNTKGSNQYVFLEPIQENEKGKQGNTESLIYHKKTNDSSSKLIKEIQKLQKSNVIEMSEVQSSREMSSSKASGKSFSTLQLHYKVEEDRYRFLENPKQNDLIQRKITQIEKSMHQNDESVIWDRTEIDPLISSFRKDSEKLQSGKFLIDSDKKIFMNMNQRFEKIKQIKYGKGKVFSASKLPQLSSSKSISGTKKVIFPGYDSKFEQKSTQTEKMYLQTQISESNVKQIYKKFADQVQGLDRQNIKLKKQINMANESINCLENYKKKLEEDNKFLSEKIKRLQRILDKNEKELDEWKEFAQQGKVQPSEAAKENKIFKEMNGQWRQKQDNYIGRIAQLEKQLQKAIISSRYPDQKQLNCQQYHKCSKTAHKYKQHIEKLHKYQQNLKRNMEMIGRQQEKIIQQWRLIDHIYTSQNIRSNNSMERYQYRTVQREDIYKSNNCINVLPLSNEKEIYERDNDVASIGAKIKSMRSQLARDTR